MRYIKYFLSVLLFVGLFSIVSAQGESVGLGLFDRLQKNQQYKTDLIRLDCVDTLNGRSCSILSYPRASELFERSVAADIQYKKDIRNSYLKMAAKSKVEADKLEREYNKLTPEVKEAIRGMIAGFSGQYGHTDIVYIYKIEKNGKKITVKMDGGMFPDAKIDSIKVEFDLR